MYRSFIEKFKSNAELNAQCQSTTSPSSRQISAADASSQNSCEFGSATYYAYCGFGGMLSCGLTHTAIVPLDLVKCRLQVDGAKYKNLFTGFKVTVAEEGVRGLGKGWAPTLIGYSMQGICKFGFYEGFKIFYGNLIGEEKSYLYRTSLYLAASASAEFFADIALCPMEAVKVRIQTKPGWATTLREGLPTIVKEEGIGGLYKGLVPLWARQIPYTMMKFACFERTVEALYKHVVPKPRAECSKAARALGFKAMWKGLGARIIMIGTLTALQWFIYDTVKVVCRLPRPPPPEMPASLKAKLQNQS
ncbi:SLC25A3 [Bugula neritina]|uniref:SLC25A3 n=1 Tax=Bugula neritina TaxID=10212 RepID=A0A7J7KPK5_BUGNE|nr:SLC25A3 [Bugula neritina]